jgi:hypothetical protein
MATLAELNEQIKKQQELNRILSEQAKEEDFVSAEEAGVKISPMELLSKDADKDLVQEIQKKAQIKIDKEEPKTELDKLNQEIKLKLDTEKIMEGSVLDGGKLERPIEDIIKYDGYYSWENFSEQLLKRTIGGAVVDTGQATVDLINFLGNKYFESSPFENVKFDKIKEPEYFGGSFSRDVVGFSIPFLGISRLAKGLNVVTKIKPAKTTAGKLAQGVAFGSGVGAIAEQFAFSPYETRISNLVESFPTLANPITEYLAANTADSEEEARKKMLIEGSIIGVPFDLLLTFLSRGKKIGFKTNEIKNTDEPVKVLNNKRKLKAEKIEEATSIKPKSLEDNVDLNTTDRLDDVSEKIISQKTAKKVEGFFEDVLKSGKVTRNPNIRISDQIYDVMTTPRLLKETNFSQLLNKHKLTAEELMNFFREGARTSAQNLNRLSQLSKAYGQFLKDGKISKNLADELNAQGIDTVDLLNGTMKELDGIRRAAMVGRWSTAIRNFNSQTGRVGIDVINQSFQYGADALWQKITGKTLKRSANPITAMQGFLNIFRQINPARHKKIKTDVDKILGSIPKEYDRLFLRYSSDVVNAASSGIVKLRKFSPINIAKKGADLLNFLNKFQEFVVRRAVFLSSLDAIVRNNKSIYGGKNLNEIINNPNLIKRLRKEDIAAAVDHALELTYASEPKGGIGEAFVKFVNKVPFTLSLAIPFPRFLINSLKFLYDYSPLPTVIGGVRAVFIDIPLAAMTFSTDGTFTKSFFKKLKNGETSGMVKSLVGWGLFATAIQIRDSKIAGEKWNEIKVGNKTIDVYPYNPLAAYLYVADLIDRYQAGTLGTPTGRTKEIAKVFLGTRGGTGLYLVDQLLESLASEGSNKGKRFVNELLGKIAAQYFTPFKTYMGFLDAKDGNIQAAKDTKTSTLDNAKFDPTISIKNNLKSIFNPGELPDLTSVTHAVQGEDGSWKARPLKPEGATIFGKEIPGNVITELTGVGIQQPKNSAEKELDRLNFQYREIFRSTGIPVLDRAFKNVFAPMIHNGLSTIVEGLGYQNMSVNMKRLFIKEFIKGAREDTMKVLQNDASLVPYLMEYDISKIPSDQRKILNDVLGSDYINTLLREFQSTN